MHQFSRPASPILAWLGIEREVHTAPSTTNSEPIPADGTVPTLVQDSSNGKKEGLGNPDDEPIGDVVGLHDMLSYLQELTFN